MIDVSKLKLPFPKANKDDVPAPECQANDSLCRYSCDKAGLILIDRVKWYLDYFTETYNTVLEKGENLGKITFLLLDNLHKYPEFEDAILVFIAKNMSYEQLTKQYSCVPGKQNLLYVACSKGFLKLVEWFFDERILFKLAKDDYRELLNASIAGDHEQIFRYFINMRILFAKTITEEYLKELKKTALSHKANKITAIIDNLIEYVLKNTKEADVFDEDYSSDDEDETGYPDNQQQDDISKNIQAAWQFNLKKQKYKIVGLAQIEGYIKKALELIQSAAGNGENITKDEMQCYKVECHKLLMILYNNVAKFIIKNTIKNINGADENMLQTAIDKANLHMSQAADQLSFCREEFTKGDARSSYRLVMLADSVCGYEKHLCDPLSIVKSKMDENSIKINSSYAPNGVKLSFMDNTGLDWYRSLSAERLSPIAKKNKKVREKCKKENELLRQFSRKIKSNYDASKDNANEVVEKEQTIIKYVNEPYDYGSTRFISTGICPKWEINIEAGNSNRSIDVEKVVNNFSKLGL